MKIFSYNGKDPIVVPPDHVVFFPAGTAVHPLVGEETEARELIPAGPGFMLPNGSRVIDKSMLRESFNLAAKDCMNHGAVPSALYGFLEKYIFGGDA